MLEIGKSFLVVAAIATIEAHRGDMSSETDEGETAKRTVGGSSKRSGASDRSGVKSKQKLKHGRRMNRLSPGTKLSLLEKKTHDMKDFRALSLFNCLCHTSSPCNDNPNSDFWDLNYEI